VLSIGFEYASKFHRDSFNAIPVFGRQPTDPFSPDPYSHDPYSPDPFSEGGRR